MEQIVITLPPIPPYNFDLTAAYATYFRGRYGSDTFEGGVFRQTTYITEKVISSLVINSSNTGRLSSSVTRRAR